LAVNQAVVGLNADIETMVRLATEVPPNRSVVALSDLEDLDRARRLRGFVDAVSVGPTLLAGVEISAVLARLNES